MSTDKSFKTEQAQINEAQNAGGGSSVPLLWGKSIHTMWDVEEQKLASHDLMNEEVGAPALANAQPITLADLKKVSPERTADMDGTIHRSTTNPALDF